MPKYTSQTEALNAKQKGQGLKSCCLCNAYADYSLAFLLSTVGVTPRAQKCSRTILLCTACMRTCLDLLRQSGPAGFGERLQIAYTAVADQSKRPVSLIQCRSRNCEVKQ
jgi:hypothetical protein